MTNDSKSCPQCGTPLPANAPSGLCPRCVMAMNMATQTEFTEEEAGSPPRRMAQEPPTPAELAAKFPQLDILELLGRGGMGAVYKARQKELDRVVALKILPPGLGDDPAFGERFSREAKALAKLNHPNIVTLYEFGRADGLFFFLMEYVDGVNLRQLLDTGRVSSREALAIVPQICDALQYAHDQGIVHRDIKPENILMDRRGRVKVADFGLAKLVGAETPFGVPPSGGPGDRLKPELQTSALTDAGKVMGTPQYMAPEQMEKPAEVDHRADIYALGVVFYQMLTGELPGKRIEPPSKKVQIDVRLDEIVLRALEKNPERRYGQASVLKTQVENIASSSSSSVPPVQGKAGGEGGKEEVGSRLKIPALGLLMAGILNHLPIVLLLIFLAKLGSTSGGGIRAPFAFVFLLIIPVLGSLVIFGAISMMRLRNYGLCIAASIVAIITPPGILLGLPFGIWSLIVLLRRDVREAFERRRLENQGDVKATVQRFSRTAIVGVCCIALAIAAFIGLLVLNKKSVFLALQAPDMSPSELAGLAESSRGIAVWFIMAQIIAGMAALIGTILGWVGVSQIRRSAGRIYGLALALFDGLLFPLLALDALIIWLLMGFRLGFLESLVLCLPINAFLVWKIWRGLHPVAASDRTSTPISRRFGWLPIAGVLTIVALIFAGVFLAGRAKDTEQIRVNLEKELREQISELLAEKRMTFSRMQFEYSPVLPRAFVTFTGLEEHRNKTNAMPMTGALHLAFDTRGTCVVSGRGDLQEVQRTWPIRELNLISWPRRVGPTEDEQFHTDDSFAAVVVALDSLNRPSKNRFLDLDSGKVVAPPKDYSEWSRTRREQWLRENGIDLMVLGNNLQPWWLLTPVDNAIQLEGISMETWRRGIEPAPGATTPIKGEELQFPDLDLGLVSFHLKHHRPTHPEHTSLFQTANGRRGMLRISGTIIEGVETLAGVKIEVKTFPETGTVQVEPVRFEPVQFESAQIIAPEPAPRTDWFTVFLVSVLVVAIGLYWFLVRSKKGTADAKRTPTLSSRIIPILRSVAIAAVVVLVLRTFVIAPFYAVTDAASPEVPKGSWVLVYKLGRSFKPGDVVVFKSGGRDKLGRVWDQYYRAGSGEGIVIIERDHTEVLHRDVVGKVVFNTRASRASAQEPLNVRSDVPVNGAAVTSGSDRGIGPRTDFAAKLHDGSFVELVSIQYGGGSTPQQQSGSTNIIDFWNPDGTKHNDNIGWSFSPSALSPKRIPGLEYRGFVVHWNGPATSNTRLMDWVVDGNQEASGIFNVNAPKGESAENWLGILQGSDQETAKLRFALASGAYLEGPTTKTNFIWSRTDKTPWGSYSIGEIFDHNGNAAITLTHDLKGCDYRLYTQFDQLPRKPKSLIGGLIWEWQEESRRDERYKRIYARVVKSGTGSSQKIEIWEFPGVPAQEAMARLPQIYFEVRPVQWVEFANVALNPGKETEVQIRINDKAEELASNALNGFGPVIEQVVEECVDLDAGKLMAFPRGSKGYLGITESIRLAELAGVDFYFDADALWPLGATVVPLPEEAWNKVTLETMRRVSPSKSNTPAVLELGTKGGLPQTYLLQTREQGTGLLQVVGSSENPPGVQIRYKLVEGAPSNAERSNPGAAKTIGATVSREQTVQSKELSVAADGSANYTNIQSAIDAASPGATIRIGPRRYAENLVINKPLTLRGAGWNQTVIGPLEADRTPTKEQARDWQRRIMQATDKRERERIAAEFQEQFMPAVLKIKGATQVECFDLKFTHPGVPPENGGLANSATVDISSTEVLLNNCAVLGGPGDGVQINQGAVVTIERSLIAAAWNAGVRIGQDGELCKVRITDSDIRNCYHRGIALGGRQNDVTIERCRISGSAWHGIRYDDASPIIRENIIFGNARSGIYASGATAAIVQGNLFWRNEMGGMSCWYSNSDKIEQNTFTGNLREGISVLGMSEPTIHANIFANHPTAIYQGAIGDNRGTALQLGTPFVTTNLFWNNQTNWIRLAEINPPRMEVVTFKTGDGNFEANPQFIAPAGNDYSLQPDSAARRNGIGAQNLPRLTTPWPLQPEELAIIPNTDTREYNAWNRPEANKP